MFPEELMHTMFSYLGPYTLGKASCVCKQWQHLAQVGLFTTGQSIQPIAVEERHNAVGVLP